MPFKCKKPETQSPAFIAREMLKTLALSKVVTASKNVKKICIKVVTILTTLLTARSCMC